MHPIGKQLEDGLMDRGWRVVEKDKSESGRENEKWTVQSTWSPVDAAFTLEFLIDWIPGSTHSIWAVEAYRQTPTANREEQERLSFSLGNGWPGRCPEFVRSLDRFRVGPIAK